MAKAHLDRNVRVDKPYFTKLFQAIRVAIAEDKIVCPTSPLHESESNFSYKLSSDIRSMDNALSRGLSFNSSVEICGNQLLESASKFAGSQLSAAPWWRIPFNRDPDLPDGTFPRPQSDLEVFMTVQKFVDEARLIRNEVAAPMYKQYKDGRAEQNLPYPDEVGFNRIQLFLDHYLVFEDAESVLKESYPDWGILVSVEVRERHQRLEELRQVCDMAGGIVPFLWSNDFETAPFLNIHARLVAADIVHHSARKPEGSLLDDFDMASSVVPYVDVFATENYLAELLRKTGIASEYGCSVYTMRQKDELLDFIAN